MNTLEATYRIVTPMFISGADQQTAELRAPSIKGLLRFWWRALSFARFKHQLKDLYAEETQLFGSTKYGSRFCLHLLPTDKLRIQQRNAVHPDFVNPDRPGARYLAFGLMDGYSGRNTTAGQLQRPCICHNQTFILYVRSRTAFPESLLDAIKLFGLIGNIGSRSRRGFGSVTLRNVRIDDREIWTQPDTLEQYQENLWAILENSLQYPHEPSFSSFSRMTRIYSVENGIDPIALLNLFGLQMQRFRSWGHNNKVNNEISEQNFEEDHAWFKHVGNYRSSDFHPKRIIFGLPHNYGKDPSDKVQGEIHDRRASPLYIHVHEYANNRFGLFALIFRSAFLPATEKINAGGRLVPQNVCWSDLDDFISGQVGHKNNKSTKLYFPHHNPLKPDSM